MKLQYVRGDYGRGKPRLSLVLGFASIPLWEALCHPIRAVRFLRYPFGKPEGG